MNIFQLIKRCMENGPWSDLILWQILYNCLKSKWRVVWKENLAVGQDLIIEFLLHWFTPSVHCIQIVRTSQLVTLFDPLSVRLLRLSD